VLDWGSVPDWFAAVGTTGALLLGVHVLKADRERGDREQIAKLIVRYESVTDGSNENALSVHNVSGHDFHNVIATEYQFRGSQQRPSRLPTFRRLGRSKTAMHHAFRRGLGISLGHGEEDRVDLPHQLAPRSYIIVFATDARGRRWGIEGRTGQTFRLP
jgi:hypothetical protein